MPKLDPQTREHLRLFLYLYLIDPARLLADNKQPLEYEKEEPGYFLSFLKGYQTAWKMNIQHQMSHDLLKSIHAEAMAHMGSIGPGQYKKQCNHYSLFTNANPSKNPKHCKPTASVAGFKQFIQKWMFDVETKIHEIDIIAPGHLDTLLKNSRKLVISNHQVQVMTAHDEIPHQGPSQLIAQYDETQIEPFLNALEHSGPIFDSSIHCTGEFYICFINSMLDYLTSKDPQQFLEILTKQLDAVFLSYHTAIQEAHTADQKISVIAQHVQWIDQIHPFMDGNIRTCYILLNRLLKEEGLPLTLLLDPNRFDGFALEEMVKYIKEGQQYAAALFHQQTPSFHQDEYMAPFFSAGLNKSEVAPFLLKQNQSTALNDFIQILEDSFKPEITTDSLKLKYKLLDLTESSLGKALRNAAANNLVEDMQYILKHFKFNIDIQDSNPQSQKTALFIAAERGHEASIAILINAGANPQIPTANGQTAHECLLSLRMNQLEIENQTPPQFN